MHMGIETAPPSMTTSQRSLLYADMQSATATQRSDPYIMIAVTDEMLDALIAPPEFFASTAHHTASTLQDIDIDAIIADFDNNH